jgi:hypothetical protein
VVNPRNFGFQNCYISETVRISDTETEIQNFFDKSKQLSVQSFYSRIKIQESVTAAACGQSLASMSQKLRYISKVRNGFGSDTRHSPRTVSRILETGGCLFVNPPEDRRSRWGLTLTREERENRRWLNPRPVAQVEFTECTLAGHLRALPRCGMTKSPGRSCENNLHAF